jgi:threonine dehydrogenase-like Zn-dependent dehydrogenase
MRPTLPTCAKGSTVVAVGDGAVGLMGVLAAKEMAAERIIAMSRHKSRQDLAVTFGATPGLLGRNGSAGRQCSASENGVYTRRA